MCEPIMLKMKYEICYFTVTDVTYRPLFNKGLQAIFLLGTFTDLEGNLLDKGEGTLIKRGIGNPGIGHHLVVMSLRPRLIVQVLEQEANRFYCEVTPR